MLVINASGLPDNVSLFCSTTINPNIMSGALGGGNTSQLRNRKRVLSKNRTKAKLVPESKPDVEATRLVNDESRRKIVTGYYLAFSMADE